MVQFICDGVECFYKLCRLNPFTMYKLEIVSRYSPHWVETGYKSDPTVITFWTDRTSKSHTNILINFFP